ncbi:alpha/beta hydrolase [Paenibacillus thiaminolyticus]|uniref:alpha/beta hydrolase n=1 Tax=Paenibacillus thiaminolyticus TaxID=49283 RepID=UPI003D26739A
MIYIFLACTLIIIFVLIAWIVPRYAVYQMTRKRPATYDNCFELLEQYRVFSKQDFDDCDKEEIFIRSHDGLKLHGNYIEKHPYSDRIVIIVHGYTSALPWSAQFMDMFFKLGYNALLIDQRRHGQSEGIRTTFGLKEKRDIEAWVDWIIANKGQDCTIGLHGQSFGGGTVLEYAANSHPCVKFIVADCPYSDLTELIRHQVSVLNRLPAWPFMKLIDILLESKAGFRMKDVSPRKVMETCKLPILFIHGAADIFVPTHMSIDMYEAKPEPKELLLIDEATHGVAYCYDKERYADKVTQFVIQHTGLPTAREMEEIDPSKHQNAPSVQQPYPAYQVQEEPSHASMHRAT